MKKLLKKLHSIYKNINIEIQFLVFRDAKGVFISRKISNDVSEDASNSSYEKFEMAVKEYFELGGTEPIIVHNHPKAAPTPSLMDYTNAALLKSWSSVLGLPLSDYMVFSTYGYYSFAEAKEWEVPILRSVQEYKTSTIKMDRFDFSSLYSNKERINQIMRENGELLIANNKMYFSTCLPLEKIIKEVENVDVKIIFFLNKHSTGEKTYELVKRFLSPMTIIEVLPDGEWESLV
ncbi:hypothetical protein MZM54_01460 [[Brevibacterium] frigoritolerans]|nr:hypothetical protein [Peribacillus frigoritolerans]